MGIEDFIGEAAGKLGAGQDQVRSATGGLLGMIKDKADGADFQQLLDKIPGADGLLSKESAAAEDSGGGLLGGLGGLAGAAGSLLGGGDKGLGALSKLAGSGLDTGKLTTLVPMFFDFAKNKLGGDTVGRLLGKLPELKNLIG